MLSLLYTPGRGPRARPEPALRVSLSRSLGVSPRAVAGVVLVVGACRLHLQVQAAARWSAWGAPCAHRVDTRRVWVSHVRVL